MTNKWWKWKINKFITPLWCHQKQNIALSVLVFTRKFVKNFLFASNKVFFFHLNFLNEKLCLARGLYVVCSLFGALYKMHLIKWLKIYIKNVLEKSPTGTIKTYTEKELHMRSLHCRSPSGLLQMFKKKCKEL